MKNPSNALPIGVFDSGVGGLTVLNALQKHLPNENFLYLGDTARLPYGTKSPASVIRYAKQASEILLERGVKLLVIACNTASTLALDVLKDNFSVPTLGVLEPGAKAACAQSLTGCIAVIATEATVNSQGYQQAIKRIRPEAQVIAQSCGLFVSLAEEGWTSGPIVEAVAQHYFNPLLSGSSMPDCLVLGCTHFPVFIETIQKTIGNSMLVIDSAKTTAEAVAETLQKLKLANLSPNSPHTTFLVTDAPERFARAAKYFLGIELSLEQVELVDLQLLAEKK